MERRFFLRYLLILTVFCSGLFGPGLAEGRAEESVELLDEMESQQLFAALCDKTLIASSGAGAWEGRLNVEADGSFAGYYYDEDAGDEVIYEVSFSGCFRETIEMHGVYQYWLWVDEIETLNTPGTEAAGVYGERVLYTDPPFQAQDYMVLTLSGTPNEYIPETVRGEIGGAFGEWEDYSWFVTLTRPDDGWGFFASEESCERYELPAPVETVGREENDRDEIVSVRYEPTGGFVDQVIGICEKNGLGLESYKTPLNFAVYQGIETESTRTWISVYEGQRDPTFSVMIDEYQDPAIWAEEKRICLEREKKFARSLSGTTKIIVDSDDAIGTYMQPDYTTVKDNVVYYKFYDNCALILLASQADHFDLAMKILEEIEAAARTE